MFIVVNNTGRMFDMSKHDIYKKLCGRAGCDQYSLVNQVKLWSIDGNITRLASTGSQSWIDDYLSYMTTSGCCQYDNDTLKPCNALQFVSSGKSCYNNILDTTSYLARLLIGNCAE